MGKHKNSTTAWPASSATRNQQSRAEFQAFCEGCAIRRMRKASAPADILTTSTRQQGKEAKYRLPASSEASPLLLGKLAKSVAWQQQQAASTNSSRCSSNGHCRTAAVANASTGGKLICCFSASQATHSCRMCKAIGKFKAVAAAKTWKLQPQQQRPLSQFKATAQGAVEAAFEEKRKL